MTNDDFVDLQWQILTDCPDEALGAISIRAWYLYDDIRTHKLKGKWALTQRSRREVARWIVFLHSDLEYEWPSEQLPGVLGVYGALFANLLTLGWWSRKRSRDQERHLSSIGDLDVWPFVRRADFAQANSHPRLLSTGAP